MICIFPDPYPDELLYSVCARYQDLMQYPNSSTATSDFFGSGAISSVVDLPNRLEFLVSVLPPGHLYTVDEFIDNHTMFPLYSPFLSGKRVRLIREEMRSAGDNRISARLGIMLAGFTRPSWLRFCPECVEVDRHQFGETYWHRIHQVFGVEVCTLHSVFLETSNAPFSPRKSSSRTTSAESLLQSKPARPLDLSERDHKVLLDIARNAAWLFERRGDVGSDMLRERYYSHLLRRGHAYYNGNIRVGELIAKFNDYYLPDILKSLDCEIKNTYRNWLLRLLHSRLTGVSQPPIRHILLILFLGLTAEEFFTSYEEFKPFGDAPWPCLNHAADHFGQLVITRCRITDNIAKGKTGRPMGIFSCECGFVYNRVGHDNSEDDRFRIDSVESYGPVWEKALREAWCNTNISVAKAARQLGVSALTVVRYAIRLDLPMNVPGARQVGLKTVERYKNYRRSRKEALEYYRKGWVSILEANPDASRKQLMIMASFLYLWLNKNDSEWLENHLPPIRRSYLGGDLKDWDSIDIELSALVEVTAKRLRERPGRPTRVCLTAIIREVGHQVHFERRLDRLRLTKNALNTNLESLEAYMIRKVEWAESSYQQEGHCPTRSQLMGRAVVVNRTGKSLPVQNAIDAALGRLREKFLQRT